MEKARQKYILTALRNVAEILQLQCKNIETEEVKEKFKEIEQSLNSFEKSLPNFDVGQDPMKGIR